MSFDGGVSSGERYASTSEVEGSYQDGPDRGPIGRDQAQRVQRIGGAVSRIDSRGGWFEIDENRGTTILVTMPYQASRNLQDRFQRRRRGDRVRIEGEFLSSTRVELLGFV